MTTRPQAHPRATTGVLGGLLVAVMLAAASGCSIPGADAAPAPATTPPLSIPTAPVSTATPGQEEAELATAAYAAYIDMQNTVDTGYDIKKYGDKARPESVLATTMDYQRKYIDEAKRQLKERGEKLVGETVIVRSEVVESKPVAGVPGGHRVVLETCIDLTGVTFEKKDGKTEPARNPYLEEKPTLYYDKTEPAGWKVASLENKKVEGC